MPSKIAVLFLHSREEVYTTKVSISQKIRIELKANLLKMSNKRNLLLLFERKLEPVFMEKGPTNAVFDVPERLLSDRYKGKPSIKERFGEPGGERIALRSNISIPNLSGPMKLGRDENFSLFIPRHRDLAAQLVHIFMGLFYDFLHTNDFDNLYC